MSEIAWREKFASWARPPSESEEERGERTARMVRDALRSTERLAARKFDVIVIGSVRNNTNVRLASDVDIAAVLRDAQYSELAEGLTKEALGLTPAQYGLDEFRKDVYQALAQKFGGNSLQPGRIASTVDASSARLNADVTPYVLHRRYSGRRLANGTWESTDGIETRPVAEPNRRLIQWPEQHYAAANAKNKATEHRFKRIVRILKNLRNELSDRAATRSVAGETSSCFIEHAVFNVPNEMFNRDPNHYYADTRSVLAWLFQVARSSASAAMKETGGIRPLFREDERWTPRTLENFATAAWRHIGFAT